MGILYVNALDVGRVRYTISIILRKPIHRITFRIDCCVGVGGPHALKIIWYCNTKIICLLDGMDGFWSTQPDGSLKQGPLVFAWILQ